MMGETHKRISTWAFRFVIRWRKVSHFIGLAIIAAFIAYPIIRYGLDAIESTAIVFF